MKTTDPQDERNDPLWAEYAKARLTWMLALDKVKYAKVEANVAHEIMLKAYAAYMGESIDYYITEYKTGEFWDDHPAPFDTYEEVRQVYNRACREDATFEKRYYIEEIAKDSSPGDDGDE